MHSYAEHKSTRYLTLHQTARCIYAILSSWRRGYGHKHVLCRAVMHVRTVCVS